MAVGVTLRDFCENTSVHGLAFVVESKSSILKRLAWMTIFLMCLSYAIMQIKESIDGKLRNSVLHTYIIKMHETFMMPVPTNQKHSHRLSTISL
jgi:hypothetical protein